MLRPQRTECGDIGLSIWMQVGTRKSLLVIRFGFLKDAAQILQDTIQIASERLQDAVVFVQEDRQQTVADLLQEMTSMAL